MDASLTAAVDALRAGHVVVHPTETCYGLACDLANPDAVARVFALKRRPSNMPVSALFASVDDAKNYVVWNDEAEKLAAEHLPGPLTMILPMREDAPFSLSPLPPSPIGGEGNERGVGETLGVRISSHPTAMALVRAFGSPISTTSANLHGKPNPYSLDDIRAQFPEEDLRDVVLLDGGTLPNRPPSKIIDLATGRIIRP